jgi:cytochrome c553
MKRLVWVLVLSGGVAAAALLQPSVHADDAKCGDKGQPSCPLQGWMEKNMDPASEKGDLKALAAAFEKAAGFAPDPKWNEGATSWSTLAKEGAALANKGDLAGAKKQCKACHKAWRDKYKQNFRTKPVPTK